MNNAANNVGVFSDNADKLHDFSEMSRREEHGLRASITMPF